MNFSNFDELLGLVRGRANHVAVPGANNPEALEAIKLADEAGLISGGYLIGEREAVSGTAARCGLNTAKFTVIDCAGMADMCAEAVRLVTQGKADFLVKGLVDTRLYMKAILNKEAGLVPPGALLNHFALLTAANYKKPFVITDSAILISPDLSQKVKILNNSIEILHRLGVAEPKISVVCPVEKVNEAMPSTVAARELAELNRSGGIAGAVVEGPYDVYISFSRAAADEKGITGGVVPGDADLLLMPNLDAGNLVYKSIIQLGAGIGAAAILVGAKIPAILPSRADTPATKLNSIALAAYLKRN
ncbi:MAG: phosphate acyltransferase [Elusimicrobiaceae bacterium]|nr:phosphate acyltransferase [Elusimicrobiaceae bacterium]